jgi:hypothetical protein
MSCTEQSSAGQFSAGQSSGGQSSGGQRIGIPVQLRETVSAWAPEQAAAWLDALPGLVAAALDRWELTVERVFEPGGQISLIVYVRRADGTPAVLKLGLPSPESAQEHAALAHWDGRGAVRLLAAAPEDGALLLERLHGEIPLRSLTESKAMLEATGTLQRLWTAPPERHPFTLLSDHVAGLSAEAGARRSPPGCSPRSPSRCCCTVTSTTATCSPPTAPPGWPSTPNRWSGNVRTILLGWRRTVSIPSPEGPGPRRPPGGGSSGCRTRWRWTASGCAAGRCSAPWRPDCGV